MVFSLATLLDLNLPPNNVEAEFYHQVARAGLSCDAILVEPTVPAIQTLVCWRDDVGRFIDCLVCADAHVSLSLAWKPKT